MPIGLDLSKFKNKAKLTDRYTKQLLRLRAKKIATGCIEEAVDGTLNHLSNGKKTSLVIYGEPQSGKTEMMICLTAILLDKGHTIIVHLMNDSVDLLTQNLKRFKASGLAPAAKSLSEVLQSTADNHCCKGELVQHEASVPVGIELPRNREFEMLQVLSSGAEHSRSLNICVLLQPVFNVPRKQH